MTQPFRLPRGGRVDRTKPLRFRFDGRALDGYHGDTLASALLANGIHLVGRAAGMGRAARARDPARYQQRYAHCDVLVVGGGPAGLAAAIAAGATGARVILADDQAELGGQLLAEDAASSAAPALGWIE